MNPPIEKLTDYLLYILLFPQLIAGPIVQYNTIADQIKYRKENVDKRLMGCYRFCIGLAKKVLIANTMAVYADQILNGDVSQISSGTAWMAILAYTFQIYYDFSGYSDMAIGLGKMMGFDFPENFDSPYLSKNISEFWRRWHMTLGEFMKYYLYIPLGGNRVKTKTRLYFNLGIVFLLSGLWHGAKWNFVLWGAYHGVFLILDRLFLIKFLNRLGKIGATLLTFFIVMVGWSIFRMENFDALQMVLHRMFAFDFNSFESPSNLFYIFLGFSFLFAFFTMTNFGKKVQDLFFYRPSPSIQRHFVLFGVSSLLFVLSVANLLSSNFNPFIYYRF